MPLNSTARGGCCEVSGSLKLWAAPYILREGIPLFVSMSTNLWSFIRCFNTPCFYIFHGFQPWIFWSFLFFTTAATVALVLAGCGDVPLFQWFLAPKESDGQSLKSWAILALEKLPKFCAGNGEQIQYPKTRIFMFCHPWYVRSCRHFCWIMLDQFKVWFICPCFSSPFGQSGAARRTQTAYWAMPKRDRYWRVNSYWM